MKSILPYDGEHEMFRTALANFIENEVMPYYAQWEKDGAPPREVFKKMGDNGYLCTWADEKYGGVNADFLYDYIAHEEFMKAGANSLTIGLHSSIVAPYFQSFCTEEQKDRWMPGIVSGDLITSIAMTEPGAGSDLLAMRTRAVKDGDSYILNGSKTFISNGLNNDLAIVAAKTNPEAGHKGISLFVVERDTPGFTRGKNIPKIGFHAGDTAELFFEDCRVPAANMMGKEGAGFVYLMQKLQQERLLSAVVNIFMAKRSLDLTMEYVQQRQLFGKKLSQFQNTQFVLADVASEIEVGLSFVEKLVIAHMNNENVVKEVSMAKLWVNEMNFRVADRCLQLFGGYGYCEEYDISKQFVDSRIYSIVAGTSEVMKGIIAKEIGL